MTNKREGPAPRDVAGRENRNSDPTIPKPSPRCHAIFAAGRFHKKALSEGQPCTRRWPVHPNALGEPPEALERQRVLSRPQVSKLAGLSVAKLRRMVRRGDFPKPIRTGRRRQAWRAGVILDWLDNKEAKRNSQEDWRL
jgi:prophage regulatory protein